MDNRYAISLENIYKSFGDVTVLKDVSFHLKKGSVHALVGGNGAGKSTLMKILSGVYTSDQGTIKIDGVPVKIDDAVDAKKNGIKMIFQELSLSPTLTITENVFLANELKKGLVLNKKEMADKTQALLRELNVDAKPTDEIQNLDVGIQQLVEIAKALAADAKVLIMDEPTASLTDGETATLFRVMQDLKVKGVSIVYISHRMKEIFQVADTITVLKDGAVVAEKPKDEFTLDSIIEAMIGGNIEKKMEYMSRTAPIGDDILLSVEHLTVGKVVKDVSFQVRKGEVLGIAGLMGSGRTETLEALFGLRKMNDQSVVCLEGEEVKIKNVSDAVNKGFALIPEDRRRQGLVLGHTVAENLCLPNLKKLLKGIRISRAKVKTLTDESISSLAIKTDGADIGMLSLSGGNQQKVVISKWLPSKPKLLLMDEPTAGVDVIAKAEIIDIVRKFVAEGNSTIFVSSETSEMLAICDRILIYKEGQAVQLLNRDEIESEEILEYAIQH